MIKVCHAPLFEKCSQHHGYNKDTKVTFKICGFMCDEAQLTLV